MQPISSIVESLLTKLLQLSNWLAACQILAALEDFRTCLGHTAVTQVTRQYFGPLWNSKPKESLAQLRSLGADYNCAVAQFRPRRSGLGKLLKLQLSLFRKKTNFPTTSNTIWSLCHWEAGYEAYVFTGKIGEVHQGLPGMHSHQPMSQLHRLKKTGEPCNQSPLVEDCDATFKIFKTGQSPNTSSWSKYMQIWQKTRCTDVLYE